MNKIFTLCRSLVLISAVLQVAVGVNSACAGKDEETRAKLEAANLSSLKAHILGKTGVSNPNQIFVRINYLESLRRRSEQRKQEETVNEDYKRLIALPADTVMHLFTYLNGKSFAQASCANNTFATYARDTEFKKQIRANDEKESLDRLVSLLGPFVTVPEGRLPLQNGEEEARAVASFDLNSYPVTRDLWIEVMRKIPDHVPQRERATWANCKKCPVNYVAFENQDLTPAEIQGFLEKLNEKTSSTKCTYDLPTDDQLWYSIRGDVTGEDDHPYSLSVTDDNVDQYVTHNGNSDGQIQPVGKKNVQGEDAIKKNAFGIELGNVWKLSKNVSHFGHHFGRFTRGGSWNDQVNLAQSDRRMIAFSGDRNSDTGLSLTRKCH